MSLLCTSILVGCTAVTGTVPDLAAASGYWVVAIAVGGSVGAFCVLERRDETPEPVTAPAPEPPLSAGARVD